ncbi:transcriptional regulator, XRE family with cupin sensor [Desulfacinum hydrothermale DSM 13146]|uniref:Transcriptional regulator, XRE family with cupin sensor n=1 Tax=Desulfacinum hydrothermale DSM 13146 TaxID=1121390 RepID=A0A1W1XVA1_9BACT|nr:XRE family transcriptional regulator [Desulfacinum hydrothermale]SMC27792.1 transcriptional regulator, XRE family with cupin sensor [Desulfacinum hydrothermale DSM 13146]
MAGQDDIQLAVKALKIGQKVRDLRQQYKYTLQDLAQKTGLSKPFLSQIENDHVVPPIATLMKLARALNVGLAHFFQDEASDEKVSITRPEERTKIERRPHQSKRDVNYIYESLEFRKRSKHMEPFLVEFHIQDADQMVFQSHSGEEFLYILEGELEFRTVDRVEVLRPGDSIYFDSDVSHSFRCLSERPARAVAVLYNPSN